MAEELEFLKAGLRLALERLESSRQKTKEDVELIKNLRGLLSEVVEDREEAKWSLGTDLVDRIDRTLDG